MKLFCPVCRLEVGHPLPVVERWLVLLEHLEQRHDFYADMLAIARPPAPPEPIRAHTLAAAGAALTAEPFYPVGDRW